MGIDIFLIYSEAPTKFKNKKFTLNIFGKIEGNYHDEFLKRKSIKNIFKKINSKEKLFRCINNCKGRFAIIAEFKNEIYIILDRYSKKDISFHNLNQIFIYLIVLKNIFKKIDNPSFNYNALANQFLVHGARSAKKDTIFNEIEE